MKPIAIILPTKGRPEKVEGFYKSYFETTDGKSDLFIVLDKNDPSLSRYKRHKGVTYDIGVGGSFGAACNRAVKNLKGYKYYFIVSDDHRLQSMNWEVQFMKILKKNGGGIAYGNDLFQGKNLCTSAFISAEIVNSLGYISPLGLKHMYTDNVWMDIGNGIDKLFYLKNIIVEHVHYNAKKTSGNRYIDKVWDLWERVGLKLKRTLNLSDKFLSYLYLNRSKSMLDERYRKVSNRKAVRDDFIVYSKWKTEELPKIVKKLKKNYL